MTETKTDPLNGSRYFLSRAYLVVLEPGLYGLYRNVECEEPNPKTGKVVREKIKAVGPLVVLRETKEGEQPEMKTVHPVSGKELSLIHADR